MNFSAARGFTGGTASTSALHGSTEEEQFGHVQAA
jgi:hypothetical protein